MSQSNRGLSPNDIYPIVLTHLKNARVVVIGGGVVGERKVKGLLTVGANVSLISPEVTPRLKTLAQTGKIEWVKRVYQTSDLAQSQLVFAATDQRDTNAQVAMDAEKSNLLCNVADKSDEGNFHLPAVCRDDEWVVAVSTGGNSPGQAKNIRNKIAKWLQMNRRV